MIEEEILFVSTCCFMTKNCVSGAILFNPEERVQNNSLAYYI